MNNLILFCIYVIGCVQASVLPTYGYHQAVGIPRAAELMIIEGPGLRIVGGSQVSGVNAYPYQAGIVATLTSGQTSVCGGSLLSSTRVVTAAHCWWDGQLQARQFTIVLGSLKLFSGGTRIATSDVVVHPQWKPSDLLNDIAMVKIKAVTLSNSIQAIPVPTAADANQDYAGSTATATGFGKTNDRQNSFPSTTALHHVNLNIIKNADCQKSFDFKLHASMLCTRGTGGVGTCEGDSGGPLTVLQNSKRTLVGIVSFGLGDGCQAGYPSVYTRVTSFLTWIQANL